MSYYLKDGEILWPTEQGVYDVRSKLPVGTYTVGNHPMKGWYLKPMDEFKVKGKIYGNTTARAERILNTFHKRPNATGVLSVGEKGSGKTMLTKLTSEKAAEQGIPTIVINTPFTGDSFNLFIQSIDEPCVVIFDEFEKVFDAEQQEAILTLLDGVYPSKKLFMLTANDKYRVNAMMRNRPGRIFYFLEYKGLDAAFIEEYCNDNLINKVHIPQICRMTLLFDSFNFDMLAALVEEMNRYEESPKQAMEMLNAKPYDAGSIRHNVEVTVGGKAVKPDNMYPSQIRGNPIAQEEMEFHITTYANEEAEENCDGEQINLEVTPSHLKKIDPVAGIFTYVLYEGETNQTVISIKREEFKSPTSWIDAF